MTYPGHVRNGVVVFDDPVKLPEGAAVRVELSGRALAERHAVADLSALHAGAGRIEIDSDAVHSLREASKL